MQHSPSAGESGGYEIRGAEVKRTMHARTYIRKWRVARRLHGETLVRLLRRQGRAELSMAKEEVGEDEFILHMTAAPIH
jgi:hypothetical protein